MGRPFKIEPPGALHAVSTESADMTPRGSDPFDERRLGALLVRQGSLRHEQIGEVLSHQQRSKGRPFGECAIALGLVTQEQVDHAIALQHGSVFVPQPQRHLYGSDLVTLHDPFSEQSEALRGVRAQLALRWFGPEPERRTLAIVSPCSGDGRTRVCANLAILFAQLGEPTLLIDADMRAGRIHSLFGIDNAQGLSSHLTRRTAQASIKPVPGVEHLHILPCGPRPPNPQELLSRAQFALMLEDLARDYAYILIDTPAALTYGESATIAVRSSGCLMVVLRNRTRVAEAQTLADGLSKLSAQVVGAVINER